MHTRNFLIALAACCTLVIVGCKPEPMSTTTPAASTKSPTTAPGAPAALPDNGFKAAITLIDPPAKLRAGEKHTIKVRVKNTSDVMWYARGAEFNSSSDTKFILAAGNRWLDADGILITEMDGRIGLDRDLKPGEETEVPLLITAPKEPGEYILEVDVVQEQVAWFHEKGSPTAKAKVTVAK